MKAPITSATATITMASIPFFVSGAGSNEKKRIETDLLSINYLGRILIRHVWYQVVDSTLHKDHFQAK